MKPNVIWIFCDELRADVLQCYSGRYQADTPNINRLADKGTVFHNCFTNSPVCVPSRTAIMAGRYPEQTGIYHNQANWPNCRFTEKLAYQTIPELFALNGYVTGTFGKSHLPLGIQPFGHFNPEGGGMREISDVVDPEKWITPPLLKTTIGGEFPGDQKFPAENVTENGIAWMREQKKPFFIRYSYLQPHTPVFPPPPYNELYKNQELPDGPTEIHTSKFEHRFAEILGIDNMLPGEIKATWQYYLGLVAWLDGEVGKILDAVPDPDNTIIIFDADHGASLAEGGCYAKHTFAPQVHRVPRIIKRPGYSDGKDNRYDNCESIDLGKTLFQLCGIACPDSFGGTDLFGDITENRAVYSTIGYGMRASRAFPNLRYGTYTGDSPWPRRACIRKGDYRLDMNIRHDGKYVTEVNEDIFFTDVRLDPEEKNNMAAQTEYDEIIADLRSLLLDHCRNGAKEEICFWA